MKSIDQMMQETKINAPEAVVEVKRLSSKEDGPALFKLRAMSFKELDQLRDVPNENLFEVATCIVEPRLKDYLNPEKGLVTTEDVVKALFRPGEVSKMAYTVRNLTGFYEDSVVEMLKNA